MALEEPEESHGIGKAPAYYVDIPLIERKASQRERLIQRKPLFTEQTTEPDSKLSPVSSQNRAGAHDRDGQQWEPGLWRQFPYRGFSALLFSLFCMAGSIAILYTSDGQLVQHWKLSPTVYLALFTTGANISLRFAFNQGVKISWWYTALNGSTVRDLHHLWLYGDNFWSALFSGRNFNLVALASVATTLVVIDQPLIQRASTVVPSKHRIPCRSLLR